MFRTKQKSKIDILVKENETLEVEMQRIEDKTNEENSRLENIINKYDVITKALRDKTFRNKEIMKNEIAAIKRQIERNNAEIKLENEINNKRVLDLLKKKESKN